MARQTFERASPSVLSLFQERVAGELAGLDEASRTFVQDCAQRALDRITLRLSDGELDRPTASAVARAHRLHMEQVLQACELLRRAIFEMVERDGPLPARERDLVLDAVAEVRAELVGAARCLALRASDVERLEQLELALEHSKEQQLVAARVSDHAIWDWDLSQQRVSWSAGADEALQQSVLALSEPQMWLEYVHPGDRERVASGLREAVERGRQRWSDEFRFLRRDGRHATVLGRAWVLYDAAGEPTRVVGALADISEQVLARKEREKYIEDLKKTVHFSEMFVGILGHDLRNPLSAISTAAAYLLRSASEEKQLRTIRRIASSAGRMSRMIDQILNFTRIRLGQGFALQRRRTDLTEACQIALDELEMIGSTREIVLEVQGDPIGTWDGDRLAELVSNLVGNALHHGRPGTAVRVAVDGRNEDSVQFEICNDGVIAPEILPVLFEPLRTSAELKGAGSSGLGLGLYISRQLVLAHGGTIRVTSTAADGTRFIIVLPRHSRGPLPEMPAERKA